jgi:hypothetical protein
VRIVYGLFFERTPYTLPHFLAGLSVTLMVIIIGGLFLVLGAWPDGNIQAVSRVIG